MVVKTLLKGKPDALHTVPEGMLLIEAVEYLNQEEIGALIVVNENTKIHGIISERDIVRAFAQHGSETGWRTVGQHMTDDVITCSPGDSILSVMKTMTEKKIRHLPVLDGGEIVGLVSIGDVVKQRLAEVENETQQIREYISGRS